MQIVMLTALGVGCATVIGAVIGFGLRKIPHRFNDAVMGFAAGVMLAAAVLGLIVPSVEFGGKHGIWITILGIMAGALFLHGMDAFVPHLHSLAGLNHEHEAHPERTAQMNRILLFVSAIALHNLPEGIAAGVSFGTGDISGALTVAGGIALQNIPEGMVIIAPMLAAGISRRRTFFIALATGLVEVVGTLFGFFAVQAANAILPFALAFAGGTMLYVIGDEMIPETHSHGFERSATYALLAGFCVMLAMDFYMG